jgi:hypothetical protein
MHIISIVKTIKHSLLLDNMAKKGPQGALAKIWSPGGFRAQGALQKPRGLYKPGGHSDDPMTNMPSAITPDELPPQNQVWRTPTDGS